MPTTLYKVDGLASTQGQNMTIAIWTMRLVVLFLVVPAMLLCCSLTHAQDKNAKKQPDPAPEEAVKQKQYDTMLKALEENRMAVESLKSQLAKAQAGAPQAT